MSPPKLLNVGKVSDFDIPVSEGESQGSKVVEHINGAAVCSRDIVFDVFWLLTGQGERWLPRNKHGHCDLGEQNGKIEPEMRLALASGIGSTLEELLLDLGTADPVPRWPQNKKAAACIGHDVDYPEVIRWLEPLRVVFRQGLSGLPAALSVLSGRRTHWHFNSWVEAEKRFGVTSAFYFVARQGSLIDFAKGRPDPFYNIRSERFRELFGYLADEGFEIGLHASYDAHTSQHKFLEEKELLEQVSGQPVVGNRHHYWHMNPDDPETTLLVHEQVGLKYDTSLTHERYVGWRRGTCWPFFPFGKNERRAIDTLQLPTAWMDDQFFGHKRDNPGEPKDVLKQLVDRTRKQGGCLVLDVHDYVFDSTLFPGWSDLYFWLLQLLVSRGDFWIDTPAQIARHWTQRYRSISGASKGLT